MEAFAVLNASIPTSRIDSTHPRRCPAGTPRLPGVSSPVVVRPAQPDEVPALAQLAALTFPLACPPGSTAADQQAFIAQHLAEASFERYLADEARDVLVVGDPGGPLAGYAMLVAGEPADPDVRAVVTDRPAAELSKMYAHPDHHGTGVAAALMAAALDAARRRGAAVVWLGVNQLNARAQAFYARSGFERAGTKHFVVGSRTEDDYILTRRP